MFDKIDYELCWFGFSYFRLDALLSIMYGNDVLVRMETACGKSFRHSPLIIFKTVAI